jgi:hypothetical protein
MFGSVCNIRRRMLMEISGVGLGSSNKSDPSRIAGMNHILTTIITIHFIK